MSDARGVATVTETEFIAAEQDHLAAVVIGGMLPFFQSLRRWLLADEGDGTVAARHVEHLVHRPVGRVWRDFGEELRRREGALVHHVEDDF